MAHTLVHRARTAAACVRRPSPREDALDPIRGIVIGALLSIVGFWLPLAFVVTH
jgi:hypothetical protein